MPDRILPDVLRLHALGVHASEKDLVRALGVESCKRHSATQDRDVWRSRYLEERQAHELTLRSRENAIRWFGVASIVILGLSVLLLMAVSAWRYQIGLWDAAEQLNYEHARVLASVELRAMRAESRASVMQQAVVSEALGKER